MNKNNMRYIEDLLKSKDEIKVSEDLNIAKESEIIDGKVGYTTFNRSEHIINNNLNTVDTIKKAAIPEEELNKIQSTLNEFKYLNILKKVIDTGEIRSDRTNTGTISLFGLQEEYDVSRYFPLLTTKKLSFNNIATELLWFLNGDTNIEYLNNNKNKIWDEWADDNGDLGPIYGKQWVNWDKYDPIKILGISTGLYKKTKGIDQIRGVINDIINNPWSRRLIVSAWNVSDLDKMNLHPCHSFFQFYVIPKTKEIDIQFYQRSCDMFLGVPYNIASYALLLNIIGYATDLKPRKVIHTMGDAHIYVNHVKMVREQLSRTPVSAPKFTINPIHCIKDEINCVKSCPIDKFNSILQFGMASFNINNYNPMPSIKAPIAV